MDNTFSNPVLMQQVKENLYNMAAESGNYCDPMFGKLFIEIIEGTDQLVPRFSSQGHWFIEERDDEGEYQQINLDGYGVGTGVSHPHICFLCTQKGKRILDQIFDLVITKAKREDYPLFMFKLETEYFGGPGIPDEESTYHVTLIVDGPWALNDEQIHKKVVQIINDSVRQVLMFILD